MRILFILGSFELKKNGVADYVNILRKHLQQLGNECFVLAINDPIANYADCELKGLTENSIIRIPNEFLNERKTDISKQYIALVKPDIISLQFVPYAFHPKGLPFFMLSFVSLFKVYKVHIMFHELWIDYGKTISLKDNFTGWVQKQLIHKIIRKINPLLITTSILDYTNRLLPVKATILPLFGNIEPENHPEFKQKESNDFYVVFFGSFSSDIDGFMNQLKFIRVYAQTHKLKIRLMIIGRNGPFKDASLLEAKRILGRYAIEEMGECSPQKVSTLFQMADLGISRANQTFIGKSGSTIAMLEHGLPVLVRGKKFDTNKSDYYLETYSKQILFEEENIKEIPAKIKSNGKQKFVAQQFMKILQESIK